MKIEVAGFDWDHGNRSKCRAHGVSTAEIEALFSQVVAVFPDPDHSQHEDWFKAIGSTEQGRHVFLVFTMRRRGGRTLIRPISARYMHRKEVEHYEKEASQASQRQGGRRIRRDR